MPAYTGSRLLPYPILGLAWYYSRQPASDHGSNAIPILSTMRDTLIMPEPAYAGL